MAPEQRTYTHGAAVGLGYVACEAGESAAELLASSYEIEVAGERFAAEVSLKPLYDPKWARIRGCGKVTLSP